MITLDGGVNLASLGPGDVLVTEGFYEKFQGELREAKPVWSQVFKMKESRKRAESAFEVGELTLAEQASIAGQTEFESPLIGGSKEVRHLLFKRGVQFAEEDMEDDLYESLGEVADSLPRTFTRRVESLCAGVFSNIFTAGTGTLGFDGVPIVSKVHPYLSGRNDLVDGSLTWTNRLENDSALSPENIAALHILLRRTRARDGVPAGLFGNKLVVEPENENRAWEITSAVYKAFTDTNEKNLVGAGGLRPTKVISWEWQPSKTQYTLLDGGHSPFFFFWRRRPQLRHQTDILNGIKQFLGRMRCSADAWEPRGVAATPGA